MSRRRFGEKAVSRWLAGRLDDAPFLGLDHEARDELLFRARGRFERGDVASARRIYELIHRFWPDSADAALGLGACRQFTGDFSAAVSLYERALALRPGDPHAGANRAECLLLLGRHAEARAALAAVSAVGPDLRDRVATLRRLSDEAEAGGA